MPQTSAFLALIFVGSGHAFVPGARSSRLVASTVARHYEPPKPISLSEIQDDENKTPAWMEYQEEQKGNARVGATQADDYDDYIDGDGFDGGDGQLGVVGDGDHSLGSIGKTAQTIRSRAAASNSIGGNSKQVQKNTFGHTTGYADTLKKEGLVDIDEFGEDRMFARRQQLENWGNQRALKEQQNEGLAELAALTGVEYDARRATQSYFNALDVAASGNLDVDAGWNMIKGDAKAAATTESIVGLAKGDVTEAVTMTSSYPSPAFLTLEVKNDINPFQDFIVGFSGDSANGGADFDVVPKSGTLNRRNGEPTGLAITFKPLAPGGAPREVWVVVETEESRWTYHVTGNVM